MSCTPSPSVSTTIGGTCACAEVAPRKNAMALTARNRLSLSQCIEILPLNFLERPVHRATTIPVCLDGFGAIITSICCGFGFIGFSCFNPSTDRLSFDCSSIDRVQGAHFYAGS